MAAQEERIAPPEEQMPKKNITKLPPIPTGTKVQKRPLIRRQAPASSKSRIIYVSSSSPLMSTVNRVRKQLEDALRGNADAAPKHASLQSRVAAIQRQGGSVAGGGAVVTVMGAGKAISKALAVASWYEQQADCIVSITTRTVGTVDDLIVEDDDVEDQTRLRKLSCLEVAITLK